MAYAIAAPVELSVIGKEVRLHLFLKGFVVQGNGVASDSGQANAAHGRNVGAEIGLQQALAQTDTLKNLGATV